MSLFLIAFAGMLIVLEGSIRQESTVFAGPYVAYESWI